MQATNVKVQLNNWNQEGLIRFFSYHTNYQIGNDYHTFGFLNEKVDFYYQLVN